MYSFLFNILDKHYQKIINNILIILILYYQFSYDKIIANTKEIEGIIMNKELKQKIKNDIKEIIEEIEYEEYKFNQVFHSNVEFQKSYYKFDEIFEKYGKQAYLKYVPRKYKKQELKDLISEEKFLQIYEHYGVTTLQNLEYSANLANQEIHTQNKFKLLFIKIRKLLSSRFISLPSQTILALPEGFSNIIDNQKFDTEE